MNTLLYLLTNRERRKAFLLILGIAIPIFAAAIVVVNVLERRQGIEGTPDGKGGTEYYYRESSGLDALPPVLAKRVAIYPGSEVTYMNVKVAADGSMQGDLLGFSPDPFPKIAGFYKTSATVTEDSPGLLELERPGLRIRISEENTYPDDPVSGQTKYRIGFYPSSP